MIGLVFVYALFMGWRKLDPQTKKETKKERTTKQDNCSMEEY